MSKQDSAQKLKKSELLKALGKLKPALARKDIIEEGVCFNFHGEEGVIVTSDGDITIAIPFETGITGSIKADELYRLLDKIEDEEITVEVISKKSKDEGKINELRIKGKNVKAGITLKENLLPIPQPENDFLQLPEDFKSAISFALFSVGQDMTKPHLTCIHIDENKVISSDRYRITQIITKDKCPQNFLIPGRAAEHIIKYEMTHVIIDDAWLHFSDKETDLIFSCRRMDAKKLEVDHLFNEFEGNEVQLPNLTEELDRVKIMVDGDCVLDHHITLTFDNNCLTCRGEKNIGWIEEDIPIEYDGPKTSMVINPIFFQEILSKSKKVKIGKTSCLFWGDNFRHLLALVVTQ